MAGITRRVLAGFSAYSGVTRWHRAGTPAVCGIGLPGGPHGRSQLPEAPALERDRTLLPKTQRLIYLHQSHLFIIVEEISRRGHFGEWELMVLLCREIEAQTGREVPVGSVYATLERLEEKGFVSSELGKPTAERGGRAKKYFRITISGVREVRRTQRALRNLWNGLPQLERGMG